MKPSLLALLALLSAVAFAAPAKSYDERDDIVPEEILVQSSAETQDAVVQLKKQFATLQTQLQAGVEVTPQVMQVISQMQDMLTNEIMPSIIHAHNEDQRLVKHTHQVIVDYNKDGAERRRILDDELAAIQTDIANHNLAAQAWDIANHNLAAQ